MWSEVGTYVLGLASGLGVALIEPVNRWVGRIGRRASRDMGLQVHVESDSAVIWAGMPDWIGFHYYFPGQVPNEAPPSSPREWRAWAYGRGGYDLRQSTVRLTLLGTAPVSVVVETPIINACRADLPAGERAVHPVGGAEVPPRAFDVDLDTFGPDNPTVQLIGDGGESLSGPLSWSVSKNETEQILMMVHSETPGLYRWTARLPVIIDGTRQYLDVDDQGTPFVFAGAPSTIGSTGTVTRGCGPRASPAPARRGANGPREGSMLPTNACTSSSSCR